MTSSIGCISTTHPRSPCLGPISLLSVGPTHSTRSPLRKGLSAMPTSSGSEPLVVSVACRRATYELERLLRERLDALGPAPRAELLHVLRLPDFERADRIGEFWGYPQSRAFADLLIDCEEDRTLRAVLVGMLREAERR